MLRSLGWVGASFISVCVGVLLVPCFLTENIKASHVTRFWNLAKQTQTSGGEQETPCAGLLHSRSGCVCSSMEPIQTVYCDGGDGRVPG